MVVKINIKDDLRRFSIPHLNFDKWNGLCKERTSVERCNSRFKEYLTANRFHVGGIDKVKAHIFFNALVLLASALALKRHKEADTDTKSAWWLAITNTIKPR